MPWNFNLGIKNNTILSFGAEKSMVMGAVKVGSCTQILSFVIT
jgi:hypothetical protein